MKKLFSVFARGAPFFDNAAGQGLVEYALILMLVAIAVVSVLTTMGGELGIAYSRVAASFPG